MSWGRYLSEGALSLGQVSGEGGGEYPDADVRCSV